jgi:hypothetical protein
MLAAMRRASSRVSISPVRLPMDFAGSAFDRKGGKRIGGPRKDGTRGLPRAVVLPAQQVSLVKFAAMRAYLIALNQSIL